MENNWLVHCVLVQGLKLYKDFFIDIESDSDSDSEEVLNTLLQRIRTTSIPHRIKGFMTVILRSTPEEFQCHFRVTRTMFEWLLNRTGLQLLNNNATGRSTIDPQKQLLSVLWLLATPESYR